MKGAWKRHKHSEDDQPDYARMPYDQFMMGSEDGGLTWDVLEWLDPDQMQIICRHCSQDYATFITAALNTCRAFSPCRPLD